ncbi:MAG: two-component regulator propeller domain-containing protein, partial [candidate division KSB1 bacterium]
IYTTSNGLPSNRVLSFARFQGRTIAVCSNGIARFVNNRWDSISGNLAGLVFKQAQSVSANGVETFYIATANGIYSGTTPGVWQPVGNDIAQITGLTIDARNVVWAGTSNKGLFEYNSSSNNWNAREPDGPAANSITSIQVDDNGNVWCTSGLADQAVGFMIYDGLRWYNYGPANSPFIHDDCRDIEFLQNGERWIATFGRGITVVKGEVGNLQFSRLDQTNSGLVGISGDPRFVPVTQIKQDDAGNVWVCNYSASNGNALAVYSAEGNWRGISSSLLQISSNLVALEIEKSETTDRIWVGTNTEPGGSPGVSVFDHRGTVDNTSDDVHAGTLKGEDGLRSVDVRAIAQDRDKEMWIGTAEGLYFLFSGIARERICTNIDGTLSCLINENVRMVKVDPANNKWVGTSAGISVLSGLDNISFAAITVGNSALVSNTITDLAFNRKNGDVWIATTNGISRLRTSFTQPREDLSALSGFPNPFMIESESSRFVINNLSANSTVKIYGIDGRLHRTFRREEVPGAQVVWNGKDDNGAYVPSGVYLFVAFIAETGASAVGKVAVVRR